MSKNAHGQVESHDISKQTSNQTNIFWNKHLNKQTSQAVCMSLAVEIL